MMVMRRGRMTRGCAGEGQTHVDVMVCRVWRIWVVWANGVARGRRCRVFRARDRLLRLRCRRDVQQLRGKAWEAESYDAP